MTKIPELNLDDGLICRLYRQADDKVEQLKILCELNACEEDTILAVLSRNGIDHSQRYKTQKPPQARKLVWL